MKNPYEILGVSESDSDDKIKSAYRELAKKYHPDNYSDNPLSDLADEKMKEINEAYDTIMEERRSGKKSGSKNDYSGGYSAYQNPELSQIRMHIKNNNLEQAQKMLDEVSINERDAEWYYLNGSVQYKRGWFDNAYTNFATAYKMNPSNPEYRAALNNINAQRSGYNPYRTGGNMQGCTMCDICQGLICLDCLCDCCGGGGC